MQNNDLTLKDWLRSSEFKGSVKKFALKLGLPEKTVEDWVYRDKNPGAKNRMKLYAVTKLERFSPRDNKENKILDELDTWLTGRSEQIDTINSHIENLQQLLNKLVQEIEFFVKNDSEARRLLKNNLDGPLVAYVSNLMQLMLNENKFQEWLKINQVFSDATKAKSGREVS